MCIDHQPNAGSEKPFVECTMKKPKQPSASHYPQILIQSRQELRQWLKANHQQCVGAWVVTYKRHTGLPRIDSNTIAEEAICFGWVDSLPRLLDDSRSMLLITPRRAKSNWSALNKRRAESLLSQQLITPAGLKMIQLAKETGTWDKLNEVEALHIPTDLVQCFANAPAQARRNFDKFPPSSKRGILEWIAAAKRPATRQQRLEQTVELANQNIRALQQRDRKKSTTSS